MTQLILGAIFCGSIVLAGVVGYYWRDWSTRRLMAQTRPTWRLYCRVTRRYEK